jgi:hypothetical protein
MRNLRKALRDNLEIIPGKVAFRNDHFEIFTKFTCQSSSSQYVELPLTVFLYQLTGSNTDRAKLQAEYLIITDYLTRQIYGTAPTLKAVSMYSAAVNYGGIFNISSSAGKVRWMRVAQIMELSLAGKFFEPKGVKNFYTDGVRTDWFLEQIRLLRNAYTKTMRTIASHFQGTGHTFFQPLEQPSTSDADYFRRYGITRTEHRNIRGSVRAFMESVTSDGIAPASHGKGLTEKRNLVRFFRRGLKHCGNYRPIINSAHFPSNTIPPSFTYKFSNAKIGEARLNYTLINGMLVRCPLASNGEPVYRVNGVAYPKFLFDRGFIVKTDDTDNYVLRNDAVMINAKIPFFTERQKELVSFIKNHHKLIHATNFDDKENEASTYEYFRVTCLREDAINMIKKLRNDPSYKNYLLDSARFLADAEKPQLIRTKIRGHQTEINGYRSQIAQYLQSCEELEYKVRLHKHSIAYERWKQSKNTISTRVVLKEKDISQSLPAIVDFGPLNAFDGFPRLINRTTGSVEEHLNQFNKGVDKVRHYLSKAREMAKAPSTAAPTPSPSSDDDAPAAPPPYAGATPRDVLINRLAATDVKDVPSEILDKYPAQSNRSPSELLSGRGLSTAEVQVVSSSGSVYLKDLYEIPPRDEDDDDDDHDEDFTKITGGIGSVVDLPLSQRASLDGYYIMERRTWDSMFELEANASSFLLSGCHLSNIGNQVMTIRDDVQNIIDAHPDVQTSYRYFEAASEKYHEVQTQVTLLSREISSLRQQFARLTGTDSSIDNTPEGRIRAKFNNIWNQNPFKQAVNYLGQEHMFTRMYDNIGVMGNAPTDQRIIRQYSTDAVANGTPFRDVGVRTQGVSTLRVRSGVVDHALIDTRCYLGVELEVCVGQAAFKKAHDIQSEIYKDLPVEENQRIAFTKELGLYIASSVTDTFMKNRSMGILKHDGSIGQLGFEIVSVPGTHAWHLHDAWNGFFKEDYPEDKQHLAPSYYLSGWANNGGQSRAPWCFNDNDMDTFNRPTCGIHVHVSKNALTPLQLGKMLMFVNKNERKFIEKVAGRSANQYSQFYDKTLKHGRLLNSNKYQLSRTNMDQARRDQSGRYEAINITGSKPTVEFRIFRSNVSKGGFFKCIDFVQSVVDWTRNSSIKETTLDNYLEFLNSSRGAYPWLIKWLVENNIIARLNTKNPTFSENTFQG